MIISKEIKIKSDTMPPDVDFIIEKIRESGLEPVRWAIVDVKEDEMTLSVSGISEG